MLRRTLAVVLSLALVLALAACGNKQDKTLKAETEGIYIDLGEMKYQVQISRQLNAADPEDSEFLRGVTDTLGPEDDYEFNVVHVRATQENEFNPVAIDKASNVFAYDPVSIPGKGLLPNVNSVAAQTSIGGQLLLFKMPRTTLDNRPLELKIHNPDDFQSVGTVNLDV